MQKTDFIILPYSTLHKENITALMLKKEQPIHILELFFYLQSPRSIDIIWSIRIKNIKILSFPQIFQSVLLQQVCPS